MTAYCNIDIKKFKTTTDVNEKAKHNLRITTSQNVDSSQTHKNLTTVNPIIVTDMVDYIDDYIKKNVTEKFRKDAVKTINLVFSASPEFFETGNREENEKKFISCVNKFLEKEGLTYVVYQSFHFDESEIHAHVCLCPIVKNGSKTSLNASNWFDGPSKCQRFTKRFGELIGLPTQKPIDPNATKKPKPTLIKDHYRKVNQVATNFEEEKKIVLETAKKEITTKLVQEIKPKVEKFYKRQVEKKLGKFSVLDLFKRYWHKPSKKIEEKIKEVEKEKEQTISKLQKTILKLENTVRKVEEDLTTAYNKNNEEKRKNSALGKELEKKQKEIEELKFATLQMKPKNIKPK